MRTSFLSLSSDGLPNAVPPPRTGRSQARCCGPSHRRAQRLLPCWLWLLCIHGECPVGPPRKRRAAGAAAAGQQVLPLPCSSPPLRAAASLACLFAPLLLQLQPLAARGRLSHAPFSRPLPALPRAPPARPTNSFSSATSPTLPTLSRVQLCWRACLAPCRSPSGAP